MNPYRPLMGMLVALLLACPAIAASGPWMVVTSGTTKYYLQKSDYEALKKEPAGKSRPLFKSPDGAKAAYAKLVRKNAKDMVVVLVATPERELAVKSVDAVQAEAPPAPKPQVVAAPAGVDADVWAAIQNDGSIGDDRKAYAAQVLQLVKSKNPADFAKAQANQAAMRRLLAAIMGLGPDTKNDPAVAYAQLTANGAKSKLSVSLDEQGLPPEHDGNTKAPPSEAGAAVDAGDPTNPKNENRNLLLILIKTLKEKPSLSLMMGERFFEFMTGTEGGDYLSPELRKDAAEVGLMKPTVQAWVANMMKEGKSGEVAELYWGIGSGPTAKPDWTTDANLIEALAKKDPWHRTTLIDNLKPWTGQKVVGLDVRAQLKRSKPDQVKDFLSDAASHAAKILRDARSKADRFASIMGREEKPAVAGDVGSGAGTIKGPAKGFSWDTLYNQGGMTATIYADGDPVARKITFKIYTVKEGDALVNKLGIFDTSYQSDTFGQKFAIGPGESTFALDDRVKGMPDYKLKMSPIEGSSDMQISFARDGKGGVAFSGKLSELYTKRAEQVVKEANTVDIDGKSFLVMGQGGKNGSLLFYPSDLASRIGNGGDLSPELMTNVNQRGGDGRSVNLSGAQALGFVKGKHYNLEYNRELGYWETKQADPPKAPSTGTPAAAASGANAKQAQATDSQANPPIGELPTQVDKNLVATGNWARNEEVRDGLDKPYKDTVRVYSWIAKNEDGSIKPKPVRDRYRMVLPDGHWKKDSEAGPPYAVTPADTDLNVAVPGEIRGIGKWLATATNLNTLYFDLSRTDPKTAATIGDEQPKGSIYVNEGSVAGKTITIFDVILLPDAMLRAGYTEKDVAGAVINAAKVLGDAKGYQIAGSRGAQLGVIIAGKKNMYFWPEIKEDGSAVDKAHGGTAGDGTAFDKGINASQDAELGGGPMDVKAVDGVNDTVTRIKVDGKTGPTAALYASAPREDKQVNHYLMFRFKNNDEKIMRTGFLQVFGGKDMPVFPGEGIIFLSGATDVKPSIDVSGSGKVTLLGTKDKNKGRGVYAFYETRLDESDKTLKTGNCIGPVLWWGVDEATAKTACKNSALP